MQDITRLYPDYRKGMRLEGLFLNHDLHEIGRGRKIHVYTNFVVSLDGRIAVAEEPGGQCKVPGTIANPRDWRLYQELAAQADVLLTSARYIRQLVNGTAQDVLPLSNDRAYADLHAWRRERGLPPQPAVVILSGGNDLPLADIYEDLERPVYVATGDEAVAHIRRPVEMLGARMLPAGDGNIVDGHRLVDALAAEGFRSVYSISGPLVLKTLVNARVLDRLYLTRVHRLIGGATYDTLLEADIGGPLELKLKELYYDREGADGAGQTMEVYDVK